jgi:hypothetical protein
VSIRLANELTLPTNVITEKIGFLGRTGSGKSYAAMKLAEEIHAAGGQFVALDPVGIWYGLRLDADGKRPGLPVPVLGGLHGDIPLEVGAGAMVANLVVDRGVSVILDVSMFESDTDKARFARDFADRFFFRKKSAPSPVHLFVEEAQEFAPQNPQREEARMLHAFTRLVKIGRNFGIGVSLITQRPQEVNKKVLNQAELLFCFQLTGPQERKAVEGWIADKGMDEDIAGELPKLGRGCPHVWSPAWLKVSKVVQIGRRRTFDSSGTPDLGTKAAEARPLSPIDLDAFQKEMAATIERAKAEDPRELRRQLAEERKKVAVLQAAPPVAVKSHPVEVSVVKPADLKRLEVLIARTQKLAESLSMTSVSIGAEGSRLSSAVAMAGRAPLLAPSKPVERRNPESIGRRAWTGWREGQAKLSAPAGSSDLPKCERAILAVLSQHPDGCAKGKLALLAGYRWSGGFRNALSTLRSAGLIDGGNDSTMTITEAGRAHGVDRLPTGKDLIDYWLQHPSFGKCEREILRVLVDAYPQGLPADTLTSKTGYEWSGGFRNALSTLRTAGLIEGRNNGQMRASETLFS